MPIHEDIRLEDLDKEINLLKKAKRKIIAIVPTLSRPANDHYIHVTHYAIIFGEKP